MAKTNPSSGAQNPSNAKNARTSSSSSDSEEATTDNAVSSPLRVAFFHPDLGIGGAERLVVDAGISLQRFKNHVEFFTSYHNPKRCFKETIDGTLKVYVEGNQWPRTFFGGIGHVFWAIWRMIWCVLRVMIELRKHSSHSDSQNSQHQEKQGDKSDKSDKSQNRNSSSSKISAGGSNSQMEFILRLISLILPVIDVSWLLISKLWTVFAVFCKYIWEVALFFLGFAGFKSTKSDSRKGTQEEVGFRVAHASDSLLQPYDVYIVDQIPMAIPFLKWFAPNRENGERPLIVYYCHFPDKLLVQNATSKNPLRKIYRLLFDFLEEWSTKRADITLVNSKFTQKIYKESFKSIETTPDVLYPSLYEESYDEMPPHLETSSIYHLFQSRKHVIVSINRFERKKNHMLALESFSELKGFLPDFASKCHLVIAGGYDPRLKENIDVKQELEDEAKKRGIQQQLTLLPSFNNIDRYLLLHRSNAVIYTPENEHFGIVPIEAMYCKRPIVAVNSGGPMETIVHEETGYLCPPDPKKIAEHLASILSDPVLSQDLGEAGRERVLKNFSMSVFATRLNEIIHKCQ